MIPNHISGAAHRLGAPEGSIADVPMIRRYERRTDEPDEYTYDILWIDRLTNRCVLSYDGADPANTNPAYGAESDEDVFARKGLDINAEIELSQSVVPVAAGEAERWAIFKGRKAEREQQEADAQDLLAFLDEPDKAINPASDFDFENWSEGERDILRPALEARGYKSIGFYHIERDSFGPLIRGCVATDPDGKTVRFYYG